MSKEKDLSQKILEDIPEVFADIVNVLLFKGKEVVKKNELEDIESRSQYKFAGEYHEQERDVAKFWKKAGIRIACCGFENQTIPDKYMPIRVLSYDGGSYRGQLIRKDGQKNLPIVPVITLVLYFDYEKKWKTPRSLYKSLDIFPKELNGKINDYKINVCEIAFLPRRIIDKFKSDFWIVADYLWQMKNNPDYIPSKKTIKYFAAVTQVMTAFTGDKRFEDGYNKIMKEGGEHTMCEVLDRVEERGLQKGLQEGRSEMIHFYITNCEASGKAPETIISDLEEIFKYSAADAQAAYDEFKESR